MQNEQNQEVEVALNKDLVFKGYSSIELSTRDKFVNKIKELGYDKPQVLWVASEKIHGSNFSIHCNGQTAKYGRRTDFLTKEIPIPCEQPKDYFNESFYDARTLVKKFHNSLNLIFNNLKEAFPNLLRYSIYGEYFGGNWPETDPHYIKGGPKHIQLGVFYTPNHQFYAFDIFIVCEDHHQWIDVDAIPKFLKEHIPSVPIYAKGNFETVFETKSDIDSTIPTLLGLTHLEKNISQGLVIRPNKDLKTPASERVILKKKNKEFMQITSKPAAGKKEKKEKELAPQIAPFVEELSKYVNVNRINSVVSKFPDLKDRNKLKELVSKDILQDAQKDEFKFPLTQEKHKKVLQEVNLLIIKQINQYFIKH